jgi:hypothetical protein
MTISPPLAAILTDVIQCLGIGLLLAMLRDVAGLLLGEGRLRTFCMDLLSFVAAAVLLFGYAAGSSACGSLRWYMLLAAGMGAWSFHTAVYPLIHWTLNKCLAIVIFPMDSFSRRVMQPFKAWRAQRAEKRKNVKLAKKEKKRLQKPGTVLYN